ncbi:hypothetical protein K439DRAFT_1340540 [Ramaria rubella]|nr:hypothetical protein K439DRAFT_1340540 [Ramaria rubella]
MPRNISEARTRARATTSGGAFPCQVPPLPLLDSCIRRPRLPSRLDNHITPSPLHPPVLSQDRFLNWLTPFGIKHMNTESCLLPPHIILQKRFVMCHCIEPNTLKNYTAGLIHFTKFCNDFLVPEPARMPASESLLAAFVSTRGAGSVSEGTIRSWIKGLKLWHRINGTPWMGGPELKRAIEGANTFAPSSSCHNKRDPVTFEHIKALQTNLNLNDSFDIAVFAVATITFWSCCHLGELLIDSGFNPSRNVSRSTAINHSIATNGVKFISIHIPHTKTKPYSDNIILTNSGCSCSPTSAFTHHFSANVPVPLSAPLFMFQSTNGMWAPMKCTWFLQRCNEIWQPAGLHSIKGHGFHIGGTTFLLLPGIDPWIIMVQGRWSSQSFLSYWRKCEEILPLFIGFPFQSHSSILTTMSNFRDRLLARK